MSEFNEAPREYQPTPPHEYIPTGYENNHVAAETADVPESLPTAGAENNAAPTGQTTREPTADVTTAAAPTTTPKVPAVKTNLPLLTRLVGVAAAVVGATVIGTAYVSEARTEEARFTDVTVEPNAIIMEVEVTKWSEELQIRISGDGLDEDHYIPVEPPDEDEGADENADAQKSYTRFYEYWFEESDNARTLTVSLVGSKMFMNDVLDSRTVTLTPRLDAPPDGPPAGDASLLGVSFLFDPETAGAWVYADVEIGTWSDALRLTLSAEGFEETFALTAPRDGGTTTYFEYLIEQSDTMGLPERITVTLLGDDDAILDVREAELTEAENGGYLARIVSANATADGIELLIDAPVIEGEIMIVAEQNGGTVAEYYLTEENERLEDGSGYFEIFLTGDMTVEGGEITVSLYDTSGNLLDSTVITMA